MGKACASKAADYCINEHSVCQIWSTHRFSRSGLQTIDGLPLQCIYRGRWRHGPGPDFAEALVAFADAIPLRGDIEIHLREGDWYAHGHHRDPAYDRVILHVVLHADGVTARTTTGQALPTLVLADFIDPTQIDQLLQNDRYRDEALLESEPCRHMHAQRGAAYLGALLERAGRRRLEEKVAALSGQIAVLGESAAFYAVILDALGYGGNRELFQRLSSNLPWEDLDNYIQAHPLPHRFKVVLALLAGAAGLLPSQRAKHAPLLNDDDSYLQPIEKLWSGFASAYQSETPVRISAGRPANHPVRRLAAAAALFSQAEPSLAEYLLAITRQTPAKGLAKAWAELLIQLSIADDYWQHHFDFGRVFRQPHQHLLGTGRAGDIVVNVFIPYLIAAELAPDLALEAYLYHPRLADNEITRLMTAMLGASSSIVNSACRQQGLIHIYRQYCRFQACQECPLGMTQPF
jgi:hypothetical protein